MMIQTPSYPFDPIYPWFEVVGRASITRFRITVCIFGIFFTVAAGASLCALAVA